MEFEKTFGETVKKFREVRQLTLREVAQELEIDTSMLGKIEKNNRKPTKQFIEKFSRFFQISDTELTIAFLSDKVAYHVLHGEDVAQEILKVAEKKIKYLQDQKNSNL
jgi:transcriptional regulator with XRE-family HTH domain